MKKINTADYTDKRREERDDKDYCANKICAATMCRNPGTCKNKDSGNRWYCRIHINNRNTLSGEIYYEDSKDVIAIERAAHPERERQAGESKDAFAKRSIQFMREKMGMIGNA